MRRHWFAISLILPILASTLWKMFAPGSPDMSCFQNAETGEILCRPLCAYGQFGLPGMIHCHRWLRCADIEQDVKVQEPLDNGAVKAVFLAKWMSHTVVYNAMLTPKHHKDFQHGLKMVANLQPNPEVVQLLGYCNNVFITEYHRFGAAVNLNNLLENKLRKYDTLKVRFDLCLQYAKVLDFLHNSPYGTRVMCDSNDLEKTLSQYLLTSDLTLVANDLDALPKVNRSRGEVIKCGHRPLHGDFVAPEQRWSRDDGNYDDAALPGYDEKSDIWKIPDVCEYLLGNGQDADRVRFHLFKLHKQCKEVNPADRPSSGEVVQEYKRVQKEFGLR